MESLTVERETSRLTESLFSVERFTKPSFLKSLPASRPAGLELAGVLGYSAAEGFDHVTNVSLLGIFCESNMGLGLGREGLGGGGEG